MLSYHEFLWSQLKLIRKRWWILQFLLLFISGAALVSAYEESYVGRGMGVMASIFVILIIPELWKNRFCHCMEIEEAEPTAGLDPNERIRFRNLISELSEERLVLLSTHIVSDIEYIANEILLMKDGKLMHKGTADEIIDSMTETVWECLVDKNMVSGFMKKYKISNMKSEPRGVTLRIISHERPSFDAVCAEATLEDVFLYYFGEKAGDENAAI